MGGRFSGDLWSAINTSVPTDEGVEQLGEGPSRGMPAPGFCCVTFSLLDTGSYFAAVGYGVTRDQNCSCFFSLYS